jgi:hypothetical protein
MCPVFAASGCGAVGIAPTPPRSKLSGWTGAWTEILRSFPVQLVAAIERRLSNVLERLVLRMGVADVKLSGW